MKTKTFRFLLMILMLALATLACGIGGSETETPEADQPAAAPTESPAAESPASAGEAQPTEAAAPGVTLGEVMRFEDQGFSFQPIPDYQLDSSFGVQMLAPNADPDQGPAFMLAGGEAFEGTTAQSLIDSLKSEEVIVGESQAITVDGREGLSADIERTTGDLAGRAVAVMVTPTQQFILFGVAPKAQWEAEIVGLFEAVLASVKLFEATPAVMEEPAPTAESGAPAELAEIRQWASSAVASSEYGSSSWAAYQATGAPDTTECGDNQTAWAAASSDTVEWIELTYAVPVEPKQVNVHITYNPTYITKMELIDTNGISHQIYGFEARSYPECPTIFSIDVTEEGFQAATLRITVDQTTAPSWVEIDAVELVGMGDASQLPESPASAPNEEPVASFETPAGFLWRLGGEKAFDTYGQYPGLYGIDLDEEVGLIYIADAIYDIQVVDLYAGVPVGSIDHPDMRVPNDVKVGPEGQIYAAAWGSGKILVFSQVGEPLLQFGERGTGDGQFGDFSPTHLAVGLDGRIYALDRNTNSNGDWYDRVHIFSPQGEWQSTINFEDDWFSPGGMDVGPDGNLYIVGFIGSKILKYSPDGDLLDELGEAAFAEVFGGPQGLAIDAAGNFYVAMWTAGMVKLDPQGELLAQWGVQVTDGENPWPEGGFYQPSGIAVLGDGSQVFFTDTSSQYSYLTAFEFK
jgi:sugar lactone lactonase YvrE